MEPTDLHKTIAADVMYLEGHCSDMIDACAQLGEKYTKAEELVRSMHLAFHAVQFSQDYIIENSPSEDEAFHTFGVASNRLATEVFGKQLDIDEVREKIPHICQIGSRNLLRRYLPELAKANNPENLSHIEHFYGSLAFNLVDEHYFFSLLVMLLSNEISDTELQVIDDILTDFEPADRKGQTKSSPKKANKFSQNTTIDFSDYRETHEGDTGKSGNDYETSPNDVFATDDDGLVEKVCQDYRISTFEADEILAAHRAFEGATLNLKSAYSIRFIEQTEAFFAEQDRNKGRTGLFGSIAKMRTTLAREAREMWRQYKEARARHRSLIKAIDTYELPQASGQRPESIITALYNLRNDAKAISNPQASMEGRRAFDTLRRKENMLDRLDV